MYPDILPYLRCPSCRRSLSIQHIRAAADDEIIGGDLGCAGCGALYPVRDGIADFLGPPAHIAFLSGFENWIEMGDYLFVHAGLRPGIALEEQKTSDLCWIRDDFLKHRDSFGKIVVHGHSITEDIDIRSNRIGIDTGAFATGRLTAIGLEGAERWFLST